LQLFPFLYQLFTANFIKYGAKCKCDLKKHAIKLFQSSSIAFDLHNKELSDGLSASQR